MGVFGNIRAADICNFVDEVDRNFLQRNVKFFGGSSGSMIDGRNDVRRSRVEDHFGFVGAGVEGKGVIVEAGNVFHDVVERGDLVCW